MPFSKIVLTDKKNISLQDLTPFLHETFAKSYLFQVFLNLCCHHQKSGVKDHEKGTFRSSRL